MKIDIVLTRLAMKHPFIAACAIRMAWEKDDTIPTLGTDGRTVFYNESWMDKLPIEQQIFCVAHESLHSLLMHMAMSPKWFDTGIGPDGKPFDAQRMNRAMDYLINGALKNDNFELVPKICYDPRYDLSTDLVQLYKDLADESVGSSGGQTQLDEHKPLESKPLMTPSEVVSAVMQHQAVMGKGSSIVKEIALKVVPLAESPWVSLRDRIAKGAVPDVSSWKRPNRKLITRRIVAPSMVSQASQPLAVVVDISGSVHAQIPEFLNQVASIVRDCRCEKLLLTFVDDKVRKADTYDTMDEFVAACSNMKVPMGGGTNMVRGIDYCVSEGYSRVVVITDGHTPYGREPDAEIIWAMTTSVKAPYGEVVRI